MNLTNRIDRREAIRLAGAGLVSTFAMAAENFESFGKALTQKLIAEIAGLPPPYRAASLSRSVAPAD